MSDKTNKEAKHGKQNNQKMKPYLVMQYLLKYSDKENVVTAYEIVDYLEECGITAERRSVYRDIEEINKASLIIEEIGKPSVENYTKVLMIKFDGKNEFLVNSYEECK